jgi:hypothetical protein
LGSKLSSEHWLLRRLILYESKLVDYFNPNHGHILDLIQLY